MTENKYSLSQQIIDTCLSMNASGINHGTSGNVSARFGEGFLVTPSGVPYEDLTPEKIVEMDLNGGHKGDLLPSSEWRMHRDIYASRAEAGAVVHTHSAHATALATLRRGIPCFHYMIAVAGGTDIRCSDYATFGSAELSETMLKAMEGRKACLLANHGYIGFGADLCKALALAVEVEGLAKQYYTALQMGEPVILSDDQMAEVLEKFKTYGKQPNKG
ncbi:class II aldolase/adducin family protein [Aestuariispira insulae]|uniref:L-fuculose 1-phosphate aldolase n=1 Tax=Aestuariispira insulae TaxID=1461337 RepID=A0A3D9HWP1_9PROT|nr:class II aldolase/adducin family protein [Aestuariispira insulae]RED53923.1 L-fuculose 1-phosphate aldolase [Aestuariispira insulae]